MADTHMLEPTLLAAVRQNWRVGVAAALTAAIVASGLLFAAARRSHTAEASILLENPRETVLFQSSSTTNVDYVADQIDILTSAELARRSSETAQASDASFPYDTIDYLTRTVVTGGDNRALVVITFEAENADWAVLGANSVVIAYQEFLESETEDAFAASISALDEEVVALEEEIAAIQSRIDDVVSQEIPGLDDLRGEVEQLLPLLSDAVSDLPDAGETRAEEITEQLNNISGILAATRLLEDLDAASPELAVLDQRLEGLVDRSATMAERRDNLRVDASLLGRGVRLATPAVVSEESSVLNLRTLLAVAFIAGLAGLGVAYASGLRKRAFRSATESGVVLAAPVLGVLPQVGAHGPSTDGRLPQVYKAVTEAVASWDLDRIGAGPLTVSVTAARRQAGVTSTVASMGRVLANDGYTVLLVDGDFESKELTRTLAPESIDHPGITDVMDGSAPRSNAIVSLEQDTPRLSLLPVGHRSVTAQDVGDLVATIGDIGGQFDVILLDVPAELDDPRTSSLIEGTGRVLALVGYGDRMFDVERLRDDLEALDVVCDGVLFTRVPTQRLARVAAG